MMFLRQLIKRRQPARQPYQMSFEQRIRVIALLGKYLRTHAVMIAAIGAEKKYLNRQVMVERLSEAASKEKDIWPDLLYIFSSVLGPSLLKENIDLRTIVDEFHHGWNFNRLGDTMVFCGEVGILSRSDVANMMWVVANWRSKSG